MEKSKVFAVVLAVVVVVVLVWWFSCGDKSEGYTWANEIQELPVNNQPSPQAQVQPTLDCFADMTAGPANVLEQTSSGDMRSSPAFMDEGAGSLPMKPGVLHNPSDYLPDINSNIAAYDKDVADPQVFMYNPSVRVQIKNRNWAGADPIRGDLPIEKDPLYGQGWFNSRYGPGDNNLNGIMSPYFQEKFKSLTGQQSLPVNVANEGLVMDYQQTPDRLADIYKNEGNAPSFMG